MEDLSNTGSIIAGGQVWINPNVIRDILKFPALDKVSPEVLKKVLLETLDEIERETELHIIRASFEDE